ncbi:DUF5602 domain-containing protein [Rhodococcus gannanensis]|uniref:DUF5602 domain-containing protein n=1 Tax=Rhodococcus gannanensis TaxID=1960308 RepID=A0ABW4P2Q7_9NOCA
MRIHYRVRVTAAALAVTGCAALVAGCVEPSEAAPADHVLTGPSVPIGEGSGHTYVTVADDGTPAAVGIRLAAAALDGLGTDMHSPMEVFDLDLPPDAPPTVFESVTVDWNPHGHEPAGVFTAPHFDMHFYLLNRDEVDAIEPTTFDFVRQASTLPPGRYMPVDYVPPPGPPLLHTVSRMGLHWTDAADGVGAPGYVFDQVLQAGSWDGAFTFLEPMMTRDWMLTRQSVAESVNQPEAYAEAGYYPTTYTVNYDDDTSEYVIELGGMTLREAS